MILTWISAIVGPLLRIPPTARFGQLMSQPRELAAFHAYIAAADPQVRGVLEEVRRAVKAAVPVAQETVSYRMPAFKLEKVFFYYATFKRHLGIYPPVVGDAALKKVLLPYRGAKGNLKFPFSEPIPYALIGRVASALARERSAPDK
jgi:uncharacterized protein YdhG (YjbR/CyaY superfamily)